MTEAAKIALEEKRHDEIKAILREIKECVSVNDNSDMFMRMMSKLDELAKPDAPEVNVSVSNEEVAKEISTLRAEIELLKLSTNMLLKNIFDQLNKKQEWEFEAVRNGALVLTKIKAKQL